jgi:hypothetical protein
MSWNAKLEREAGQMNEVIDTGMLYGLLNGARGIGYVSGGPVGIPLLKAETTSLVGSYGYGATYGPLIISTGLSLAFGGLGLLWKWKRLWHLEWQQHHTPGVTTLRSLTRRLRENTRDVVAGSNRIPM